MTVDVNKKLANAFVVLNRKFVTIDGFRLGDATSYSFHALNNADLTVRNCGCFDAGSTEAACNADYNNCFSNTHCFEFAYSERVLLEDSWSWGVARYNAVLYQTNDSIIRRFACKGIFVRLVLILSLNFLVFNNQVRFGISCRMRV